VGGVPRTNAIQTDSQSGIGGYINLKGPSTLITARVNVDDVPKVVGTGSYIIRPGTFTTSSIPPIPQ
jgi:hypothetical protein